jgi:hypothetical protein
MTPLRIGKAAWLIAALSSVPAFAADQEAKIFVTATPNPVSERESVQLQVVVESPLSAVVVEPQFDAPDFIQAGNRDMKFQPMNGDFGPNTRKRLVFTYVLMPKHSGDLLIANVHTKISNQPLTGANVPVKVTVDNSPRAAPPVQPGYQPPPARPGSDDEASNPASPNYRGGAPRPGLVGRAISAPDRFNSDFTVWATTSKARAYIGEPVVVEYYLYDFGGLRQTEILQWPAFNGFWKEDLELTTRVNFEEVFVKQQEVRRAFVARYALYGIKQGRIQLDKLGVRGKYAPSDLLPGLIFNGDLRTGQHFSQDIAIDVLPLPEANRPATFRGGVGTFALKLEADKVNVPQNTPVTFTFTLSGEGNFHSLDSIKLTLPPDFELYESTASGRQLAPVGVKQELESKKTFQTVAIPRKPGKFEIPAVAWSFFNPQKEAYETITTQAVQIEVTPNESTANGANSYLGPKTAPGAAPTAPDSLRFLKPVDLAPGKGPDILTIALILAALANLALGARFLRRRSRGLFRLVKGLDRFSEARILLLQAKGIRDAEWQAGLEEVVLMTMQVMLNTNPRGLPRQELEEMWKARSLPAPLFQRAAALLDEVDRHRFSSQKLTGSGTKEVRSRLTKETESLLSDASKVAKK